ncbi:hypothetical protein F511_34199 [Dorcoceras hygrometricum]|uniref:Uncharacterized protein n=1 Tax=Dorcoceras hygrometricum TaxID=472368 RepID=A0A2Z7B0G4_9LAMI|nr:hypothetical protein F511_34199 [Dorcoceras hygrometricum]
MGRVARGGMVKKVAWLAQLSLVPEEDTEATGLTPEAGHPLAMTRYNIYITTALNAYGALPADIPEKPAMAKHMTKAAPKENKLVAMVHVSIWALPTRLTHTVPVAQSPNSTQLVPFSSVRGGSYPLVLMATQYRSRGSRIRKPADTSFYFSKTTYWYHSTTLTIGSQRIPAQHDMYVCSANQTHITTYNKYVRTDRQCKNRTTTASSCNTRLGNSAQSHRHSNILKKISSATQHTAVVQHQHKLYMPNTAVSDHTDGSDNAWLARALETAFVYSDHPLSSQPAQNSSTALTKAVRPFSSQLTRKLSTAFTKLKPLNWIHSHYINKGSAHKLSTTKHNAILTYELAPDLVKSIRRAHKTTPISPSEQPQTASRVNVNRLKTIHKLHGGGGSRLSSSSLESLLIHRMGGILYYSPRSHLWVFGAETTGIPDVPHSVQLRDTSTGLTFPSWFDHPKLVDRPKLFYRPELVYCAKLVYRLELFDYAKLVYRSELVYCPKLLTVLSWFTDLSCLTSMTWRWRSRSRIPKLTAIQLAQSSDLVFPQCDERNEKFCFT